jgi:asparagine synthase (glutamine-hydrolysing)
MPPLELAAGIARSLLVHRRRPASGLRYALRQRFRPVPAPPPYPPWLDRGFTEHAGLRARWAQGHGAESKAPHALRPAAYGRLAPAIWSWYCDASDPGVTGIPIEARYPFLDVRLVSYLLAIPPLPWCIDKLILREAMRGVLPEPIRLRPKTPLAGDPLCANLRESGAASLDGFDAGPDLARFVNRHAIPPLASVDDPWLHLRPLCLDVWLKRLRPARLEKGNLR